MSDKGRSSGSRSPRLALPNCPAVGQIPLYGDGNATDVTFGAGGTLFDPPGAGNSTDLKGFILA